MEQWLFELILPFHHIEPVRPGSHSKKSLVHTTAAHWMFTIVETSMNPEDAFVWKPQ